MEDERSDQIGSIRAEFFTTTYVPAPEFMYTGPRINRRPAPSYVQASKSDVLKATGGMSYVPFWGLLFIIVIS